MARNIVTSVRVFEAIQGKQPSRELKHVLQRGNYGKNTFLAIFADDPCGELVVIPPKPRGKVPKPANEPPKSR